MRLVLMGMLGLGLVGTMVSLVIMVKLRMGYVLNTTVRLGIMLRLVRFDIMKLCRVGIIDVFH